MTQLATALKTKRRLEDLKQSDLAERIGCSQQLIGRWEQGGGTPGTKYIQALAAFLGVDADEVLRMAFAGNENADDLDERLLAQDEKLERLELKLARLTELVEAYVTDDRDPLTTEDL